MKNAFLLLLLISAFVSFAETSLEKGRALLYSGRLAEAEKLFQEERKKSPDDITILISLAASAFGSIVMYGEDEQKLELLDQRIKECCDRSIALLKEPASSETYLYAALSFLMRASSEARSDRTANSMIWLKRALTQIMRAQKYEETEADANMLNSAYNCVMDTAPWPMPMCVGWIVQPAALGKSLSEIEEQFERKPRLETEMRIFLVWEYCREGYPRCASGHLKALKKRYPNSPFVEIMSIRTDLSSGNHQGSFNAATNFYARCRSKTAWRDLTPDAAFLSGSAALSLGFSVSAEKWFEIALKEGTKKPRLQAAAQLMLGKCADQRGERDEALRRYALVHIHKGANPLLKSFASKLQKKACDPRQVIY
ncbi:tetratricopeptide repeat protein [bacterium]|nr:tetratricopeptide repeat protein [bacterium]